MKRQWQMRRQVVARPDGQLRWDRAYQLLLDWTQPPQAAPPALPSALPPQEVQHADSRLCAGLDPTPSADPDH